MIDDKITTTGYSCSNFGGKRRSRSDNFIFDIFRHEPPEYLVKNRKKNDKPILNEKMIKCGHKEYHSNDGIFFGWYSTP